MRRAAVRSDILRPSRHHSHIVAASKVPVSISENRLTSALLTGDFYQGKKGIVDDVAVIRIQPFRNQGFALVILYLFDTEKFHQNYVGVGRDAHISPGFVVIVIFILHQRHCIVNVCVV